ncbi:DUF7674 family protein [Bradyrhizobium sp. 23AC]
MIRVRHFGRMLGDESYLERIADLAPQLREVLAELKAEWSTEVVPVTLVGAGLAEALVEHFNRLPKSTIQSVIELCEQALEDGSAQERAALSTGFLESLQHADGTKAFDFRSVAGFLGPKSREHCSAMDRFWKATTSGL